jgi:hypothetical protein
VEAVERKRQKRKLEGKPREKIIEEAMIRDNIVLDSTGCLVLIGKDKKLWTSDSERVICTNCSTPFNMFTRRHHCRSCGDIFCAVCSVHTAPLTDAKPHYHKNSIKKTEQRVCRKCFTKLSSWNQHIQKILGIVLPP